MTYIISMIVCFAFGHEGLNNRIGSQDAEIGIYVRKDIDASRQELRPQDCGRKLASSLGTASLISTSNNNKQFQLHLKGTPRLDVDPGREAIVVRIKNCVLPVGGWSSDEDGRPRDLSVSVTSRAQAEQIAEVLGIKPTYRVHPNCRLTIDWIPTQTRYTLAEKVVVEMKIKNVGDEAFTILDGGQQRGARDNQFRFLAYAGHGYGKQVQDSGDATNFGGLAAFRTVEPGEVFSKRISLDDWFKFEQPDTYQVTGIYELTLLDPDSSFVAWEKLIANDCQIHVVDMK